MNTDSYVEALQRKHQSLDIAILQEQSRPQGDELKLSQLKREKLHIKEKIEQLTTQSL